MKLLNTKTLSISLAAVGIAFVSGMAAVSHQASPQAVHLYNAAADTATTQSTSTAPSTSTTVQPAPTTSTSTTSSPTSSTGTLSPASTSTTTSTPTSSPTTTTTTTSTTPAVTAVSATVGNWQNYSNGGLTNAGARCGASDYGTTTPLNGGGTLTCRPGTYTTQYQYCTYAYSDGSQQVVFEATRNEWNDGVATDVSAAGADCALANAPAAK